MPRQGEDLLEHYQLQLDHQRRTPVATGARSLRVAGRSKTGSQSHRSQRCHQSFGWATITTGWVGDG